MSLTVLGNQSLDELQTMVVESFKNVVNKQLIAARYPADPFGETRYKTICYISPIKEYYRLTMTWAIPAYQELYYCSPISYVTFLIHHKGVGSPTFHLKKLGLALELWCSCAEDNTLDFKFLNIDIDLSIEGLERWKEVVYIIYQYIAMVRQEGSKEWIFNETKNMRMMNFQFSGKSSPADFVSNLAAELRDYPLSECLFGPYDMREFRPDLIGELLDGYLIPNRMRIYLVSKNFTTTATEKEKWYGTQYKQEYLSEEFIKNCETCDLNVDLHLPSPNDFIPDDFRLYHNEQDTTVLRPQLPRKIQENECCRSYYAEDTFYKLPKAFIYFNLHNRLCYADPVHTNISELYISLVNDSLSDCVYPAQLGGLRYYLSAWSYGIQRKQTLQNSRRQNPDNMAYSGMVYLIAEHRWHDDELLSCLDDIKPQDIAVFIRRMFAYFYVDSLMYGNLTTNQSIDYMTMFQQKFQQNHLFQPVYPSRWFNQRQLMLPDGCNYAYTMLNDGHCIQAITIYLQCFQQTLENNALIELFDHLVNERCFDQLRTKEQLAYIVRTDVCRAYDVQGFQITVQSTYELDYVNRRIERFLDAIRDYIEQMSEEDFQEKRQGCIVKNIEIAKRMDTQGFKFWTEVALHQFCFDRSRLESDITQTLKREDIIRFYDHYISPRSPHRRKLAVYVKPSAVALANVPFEKDISAKAPILDEENMEDIQKSDLNETFQRANSQEECHLFVEQTPTSVPDITKKRKLILPEITWIDHVPMWKSQLPCYSLLQPFEEINIPILHNL